MVFQGRFDDKFQKAKESAIKDITKTRENIQKKLQRKEKGKKLKLSKQITSPRGIKLI